MKLLCNSRRFRFSEQSEDKQEEFIEMMHRHQQHLNAKEEYRNSLKAEYASLSREEILEKLLDKEVYEYFYGH